MQSDNLIDENSWDKPDENNFYQEKMKNITNDGIYNIFKNLSSDFCNSRYHTDKTNLFFGAKPEEEQKNYLEQWKEKYKQAKENSKECFKSPNFSWTGNDDDKEFAPFIFFETVDPTEIKDPKAIANYVKQFVYYMNQLLSKSDFHDFVRDKFSGVSCYEENKNIAEFVNKIDSDFFTKCDKANLKLFKDSGWLYIGEQLVKNYYPWLRPKIRFIKYLKKTTVIPVIVLYNLLSNQRDYSRFSNTENEDITYVIIESISKTDFSYWDYLNKNMYELSTLGLLLSLYSWNIQWCLGKYDHNPNDKIKNALIDKCAEIFSKQETKNIRLYEFVTKEPWRDVYLFISKYLNQTNENSQVHQNLINGLKTWAKNNDDFINYYDIQKLLTMKSDTYEIWYRRFLSFVTRDKEFNQIIAEHCNQAVINHLDTINDIQKYPDIKIKVEDFFRIKLNIGSAPYKSHRKDVSWLSLWIFLLLLCFGTMISGFILIPIIPLKFVCLVILYPIYKIYDPMEAKCKKIHENRIYNATLCICKATSKDYAISELSWDMLHVSKVKNTLDKLFPDSKNKDLINID